jgi:hypothetical protein
VRVRLLALLFSVLGRAGPFVFPGEHPNYDAQFTREIRPFADLSILAEQFPQNTLVYQPPLIGYLSPENPAKWIVWTTLAADFDPFAEMALQGFDLPPGPPAPPPPHGSNIPEPGPLAMLVIGMSLILGGSLYRRRKRKQPERNPQP